MGVIIIIIIVIAIINMIICIIIMIIIVIIIVIIIITIMIMTGLRRRMAPLRGLSVTAGRSTHPRWRAVAGDHDA